MVKAALQSRSSSAITQSSTRVTFKQNFVICLPYSQSIRARTLWVISPSRPITIDIFSHLLYTNPTLARIFSCVVVEVKVDFVQGSPHITIVGLPDAAVQENRERVYSANKNADLFYYRKALTVNLRRPPFAKKARLTIYRLHWEC